MPQSQPKETPNMDALRTKWTTLYRTTLPSLAKSRDPSQPSWPVTLDHCFARIILDNTIGKSAGPDGKNLQWDKVIGKPAFRNMSEEQLEEAIALGEKIASGEVDLVELDEWSLEARGKTKGNRKRKGDSVGDDEKQEEGEESKKRKVREEDEAEQETVDDQKSIVSKQKESRDTKKKQSQSTLSFQTSQPKQLPSPSTSPASDEQPSKAMKLNSQKSDIVNDSKLPKETALATLKKIQTHPGLTPFRKRLYISLLSVPTGQHTTYAALATHLGSIPRAVGNGMRNNPFAPTVPCHRVLASDGTLGGFFGDWGVEGKHGNEKIKLLEDEGVYFNSGGKVKGLVWDGFWDLRDFEREFGEVR